MVHGLHGRQVHPQSIGDAGQIQPELQEQIYKVHLLPGEWVVDLGTRQVALRPGTLVYPVVSALIVMVSHVVHVVLVKQEQSTLSPR